MKQTRILMTIGIAQMIKAKCYIELGVRQGQTINEMVKYVDHCIGVDISDDFKHLYDSRVDFKHMDTDSFRQEWNKPVDMIFIDADHSHESSYNDFINYKDLVKDDGIILLHDTCPCNEDMTKPKSCHDTWKTAVKIKEQHSHECEITTIPDGCGVSIVRMTRGKHLIWSDK